MPTRIRSIHRSTLAAMLLALLLAPAAMAQTRTFDAGGNGTSWSDAANWSDDNVPNTSGEDAVIDAGGAFDVAISSNYSIHDLTMGADDTLTISSAATLSVGGTAITPGTIRTDTFGSFITSGAWTNTGTVIVDNNGITGANGVFTNAVTGFLTGSAFGAIGFVGSEVHNYGTIAPGFGAGDGKYLSISTKLYLESTSVVEIEIGGPGTSDVDFDQVYTPTDIYLDGMLTVSLFNGFTPLPGYIYPVVSGYMTDDTGEFANVANGERLYTTGGEGSFLVTYDIANNYVTLSDYQPVPEPAALALLPLTLMIARRRRN